MARNSDMKHKIDEVITVKKKGNPQQRLRIVGSQEPECKNPQISGGNWDYLGVDADNAVHCVHVPILEKDIIDLE